MFTYTNITGKEPNCPCCNNCRLNHINGNKWDCERCKEVFRVKKRGIPYPLMEPLKKDKKIVQALRFLGILDSEDVSKT